MNKTNTYTKLVSRPKNNSPEFLIVHHSGGTDANPLADTSHHTAQIMETQHLANGWDGLGYHYVIHKNGDVWLGRPEHVNGAHTTTHNTKSIGICLAGNFDATLPTKEQENALKGLLASLKVKYSLPIANVVPHRCFANKTCYGKKLPDDWAAKLLDSVVVDREKIKAEIIRLTNLL